MSYILDALKKSEQARESRKTRELLEKPLETPVTSLPPPKSSARRLHLLAFILFLIAACFVFLLRPWQWGGKANGTGGLIPGGQLPETHQQSAPAIPPVPLAQLHVKQKAVKSGTPPKDQEAMQGHKTGRARANRAPAQPTPTIPGVSRANELAVKKPGGAKLPQDSKAAGTKEGRKTANLKAAPKNPALNVEQPQRPAAGSGIISDIEPLSELRASSAKPGARRELKWHELAPQIRNAIPNMSVSMLIYSKKPENRWININGSKKREGAEISAGLKLEEITPDGAIFSYRGHRFFKGVAGD